MKTIAESSDVLRLNCERIASVLYLEGYKNGNADAELVWSVLQDKALNNSQDSKIIIRELTVDEILWLVRYVYFLWDEAGDELAIDQYYEERMKAEEEDEADYEYCMNQQRECEESWKEEDDFDFDWLAELDKCWEV